MLCFMLHENTIDHRLSHLDSSIVKSVSYEELGKSDKKLEKVGTIWKKSFI